VGFEAANCTGCLVEVVWFLFLVVLVPVHIEIPIQG
jgi:hypothetical protein